MGVEHFIPTLWAREVNRTLENVLVYASVCNRRYEGEIRNAGDTVKINEIGPVTINSYTANSTADLTWEFVSDAQQELKISQKKYFAVALDDADRAQATPDVMEGVVREAAYGMANTIDQYLAALHNEAGITVGSTGSGKDMTSSTVLMYISEMAARMDAANVPFPRWGIIPPWVHQKLLLAGINKITQNADIFRNGKVGEFAGFSLRVSNNVVNGGFTNNSKLMFGYEGTIAFAHQLSKVEAVRHPLRFHDIFKGLDLYGAKVVRPATLAVLTADWTAEPT